MIIIKSKQGDPFARIPHSVLENLDLSWKEKGVLSYLISKPQGWNVSMADIEAKSIDGKSAVANAMNRLIELGYARRYRIRDGAGQIKGWRYDVSDEPVFEYLKEKAQQPENQEVEKPATDNLETENPPFSKNKVKEPKEVLSINEELTLELDEEAPAIKRKRAEKFPWARVCALLKHHRPDKPYRSNPRGRTDRALKKFFKNNGGAMDCFDRLCEAIASSDYLNGRNGYEEKTHPNCLNPNWSWVFGTNNDGGSRAEDILNGKYSNENMAFLLEQEVRARIEEVVVIGRGKMKIDPEDPNYEFAGVDDFTGLKKYMEKGA